MRARTHRDPLPVDDHGDVVGMDALHLERDDGALAGCLAEDSERIDPAEPMMRVGAQIRLVRGTREGWLDVRGVDMLAIPGPVVVASMANRADPSRTNETTQ